MAQTLKSSRVIGLMLAAWVLTAMAADTEKEQAAVSVAEPWLEQVDEGRYAESWIAYSSPIRPPVPMTFGHPFQ